MNRLILTQCIACALLLSDSASGSNPQYVGIDLYTLSFPSTWPVIFIGNFSGGNPVALGQVVGQSLFGGDAILWTEPTGNTINLSPTPDVTSSAAGGTDGFQQVGYVGSHAALWSGVAASTVDLHPSQLNYLATSKANGVSHGQQVGSGLDRDTFQHALLWNATAESAVDLHPVHLPGIWESTANATDGVQQVGAGSGHALLWSGSADSAIDLHPTLIGLYSTTSASGVGGGQQVGTGMRMATDISNEAKHALLRSGTAESAIDLQPSAIPGDWSTGLDTDGARQVGYLGQNFSSYTKAILWYGTAESAVDLQALLPSTFVSSAAYRLGPNGDIYGIAYDAEGLTHAVKWTVAIPEPSSASILTIAVLMALLCHPRVAKSDS